MRTVMSTKNLKMQPDSWMCVHYRTPFECKNDFELEGKMSISKPPKKNSIHVSAKV